LRDLPTPLVPFHLFDEFISLLEIEEEEPKMEHIRKCLKKLEEPNRNCLGMLLDLLYEISIHSNKNMMNTQNLSVVMGINCLRVDSDDPMLFMKISPKINSTFRELLENFPKFKDEF
jgi:hypothetical protein